MRAILKGLLSLARACLGLKAESDVPAEPVARNVPLLTGPAPVHQGAVDAFGRSKVTRLNVKSGLPVDVEQMRVNYQSDSARIIAGLTPAQREDVRAYLSACHQIGNLFKSIRLYGKLFSQDQLMERFAKTERAYSALGLMPILPSTVNYEAAGSLADAAAQGLIQRRIPAAPITFHAAGIRRHVALLDRRFKAKEQQTLDTGVR